MHVWVGWVSLCVCVCVRPLRDDTLPRNVASIPCLFFLFLNKRCPLAVASGLQAAYVELKNVHLALPACTYSGKGRTHEIVKIDGRVRETHCLYVPKVCPPQERSARGWHDGKCCLCELRRCWPSLCMQCTRTFTSQGPHHSSWEGSPDSQPRAEPSKWQITFQVSADRSLGKYNICMYEYRWHAHRLPFGFTK